VIEESDLGRWQRMVLECQLNWDKLDNWDQEYISFVKARLTMGMELRPHQVDGLIKIWSQVMSK